MKFYCIIRFRCTLWVLCFVMASIPFAMAPQDNPDPRDKAKAMTGPQEYTYTLYS